MVQNLRSRNGFTFKKVLIKVIDEKFLNMRPILCLKFCTIWPSIDVWSDLFNCNMQNII